MRVAHLLGANALMFVTGVGLLPWLGVARSWRTLLARIGLAYFCGIVATAIVAAHLALVHLGFGWTALSVLAALSALSSAWHLCGTERPVWRRPRVATIAGIAALTALLSEYARAFAVAPLNRYDAWAIWALKGHALYSFGWADPAVFAGHAYRFANLDYPLLLPSLEAIDFRAMGAFDTRVLHLQFLFLLVAALAALATLLRGRVPGVLLWPALIALALAPAVFDQLLTAYADLPLALTFAVALTAAGRWLLTREGWALAVYGAVWAVLSWLGLSWIYVISHYEYSVYLDSSKARVVASLAVGAAALTPLLAAEAWASARGRDRPRGDGARTP